MRFVHRPPRIFRFSARLLWRAIRGPGTLLLLRLHRLNEYHETLTQKRLEQFAPFRSSIISITEEAAAQRNCLFFFLASNPTELQDAGNAIRPAESISELRSTYGQVKTPLLKVSEGPDHCSRISQLMGKRTSRNKRLVN